MNISAAQHIYSKGANWRNPSLITEYQRLQQSEWLSRADLEAIQLERAQTFLKFSQRNSRYYARLFRLNGFDPNRLNALSQLSVLPLTTKAELIEHNKEIHASGPFSKVFTAETSGTSGVALEFNRNEEWDSINRAHVMRAYNWYGVRPWDRNGYLWGYNIAPSKALRVRILDALQNRFRLFRYDRESVKRFAVKLQNASYVSGYSSMIFEVAKVILDLGIDVPGLRMVKGTSEMILDAYQGEAKRAFGRKIISEYGAAEAGLIAFECPEGRMHINIEDVILEVGDDGEAIVTNLASLSFPIIRYRLGDAVKVSEEPCTCGRSHPVLSEVIGRRGGTVVGTNAKYPALTFYYVFKNLAITDGILLNYRVQQDRRAHCDVLVEGVANACHENKIQAELRKYFSDDVRFDISFVVSLPRGNGKAQYFASTI